MDIRKLQRVVVDALDDIKAQDIQVFNTTGQTELFDRVVVATATSNRQTRALASHVRDQVKAAGGHVISIEGEESGEWVLVDLGDAVVHIMQPAIRAYYRLEELWGQKPVNLKIGPEAEASKRASKDRAPTAEKAPTKPPRKVAAKATPTSASKTARPAPRSASKPSSDAAPKPAAKVARKAAPKAAPAARARKRPAQA
jgi:ribosome-associated protein